MNTQPATQHLVAATRDLETLTATPGRDTALALVSAAQKALDELQAPGDAKVVRDGLRAAETLFKLRGAQLVDSNLLVAQRLRTERRLGEMLATTTRRGNPQLSSGTTIGRLPYGITRDQSMNWQRIADIDAPTFEIWLHEHLETDELTTTSLLKLWREIFGGAAMAAQTAALPAGTYNVVYADPPWQYDNIGLDASAESHYATMPLEDICELPPRIGLQVADNAVLFLWVTNPFLEDALSVVRAWGFQYKTNIVWVKTELERPGIGFYVRGRHELLYICTRGSFLPPLDVTPPIGSVIEAPLEAHSRKPDIFRETIERLYPSCRYLELFARQQHPGWDAWGNEL